MISSYILISVNLIFSGLEDSNDTGGNLNPSRFFYLDGTQNRFYIDLNNENSPWRGNQPDDNDDNENCVEYDFDKNNWNDIRCNQDNRVLCEKSCFDVVTATPAAPQNQKTFAPTLQLEYEEPSSTLTLSPYIATFSVLLLAMVVIDLFIYREKRRRINLQTRLAELEVIERAYGIFVDQDA